jgi:hypothetical protein
LASVTPTGRALSALSRMGNPDPVVQWVPKWVQHTHCVPRGGKEVAKLRGWSLGSLLPHPCPGSQPGVTDSGKTPCPAVSTRAAANTHTGTPGLPPPPLSLPPPLPQHLWPRTVSLPTAEWHQTYRQLGSGFQSHGAFALEHSRTIGKLHSSPKNSSIEIISGMQKPGHGGVLEGGALRTRTF